MANYGSGLPLLCLQHFTGTLDNWDPAVTDPLASGREVILFDNAGVGRSTGDVSETIAGMAEHAIARELGVDAIVEGSVARCPVRLRVDEMVAHLEENVAAADLSLTPQEIAELDAAA